MAQAFLDDWTSRADDALGIFFAEAPIFMVSAAPDWTIRRISGHFAGALGHEPDALCGRPFTDLLTRTSRRRALRDLIPRFAETGQISGAELDFLRADGTVLPAVMDARERRPGAGGEVLAVLHDDSEARAARAELGRAIAEAQEASRAKSRFLAAMGHEIRTPMNVILGFAQLLRMSGLDETRRAHVEAIESAGGTLMNLLSDLLDLSRAESGQMRVEAEPFDLDPFLARLAKWWQTPASEKGLRLRVSKDHGLPDTIVSDRGRIQQVLNNFIGNAIKFTDTGWVTLSVEELERDGSRARIRFAVTDTGPGLTADEAAQLFRPFVRIDSDCGKDRGGWGLGLAICHEIAQAMGGTVGVDSRPDSGATFYFDVTAGIAGPVADLPADRPADRPADLPGSISARAAAADGGLDILVAEDDAASRAMLCEMLAGLGHRATPAADGIDALKALRTGRFDMVILDLSMPRLGGVGAVRRIRRLGGPARRVPVIACSAQLGDRAGLRRAGMDAFLPKPVDRARMERLIARLAPDAAADTGA